MSIKAHVIEQHRGPCLRLITSNNFNEYEFEEYISKEYIVNNLAEIRLKRSNSENSLKFNISAKKVESAKDIPVEIKVYSKTLQYSEEWHLISNDWADWKYLGEGSPMRKDGLDMYMAQLDIIARKAVQVSNGNEKIYDDEEFIDFHLCAEDGSVGVHKVFLAAHSDVFRRMLQGKWKEAAEGCVELEGVTRQTLQQLKDYLYLGTLPDDGLCPLLLLARYFLMEDLKTKCIEKLVETAKADNLYVLLEFACENNVPELTFDILHLTLDETVDSAYKNKFNRILPVAINQGE